MQEECYILPVDADPANFAIETLKEMRPSMEIPQALVEKYSLARRQIVNDNDSLDILY